MDDDILLGVNIDHVATLRQVRGTHYPDPVEAAVMVEKAGADGLTLHLREDRRHIQDDDVKRIKDAISIPMNLEMAVTDEMLAFALKIKPVHCCLVPEKREELTTEGGLDVAGQYDRVRKAVEALSCAGIRVSLFIDPDARQLDAAIGSQAPIIEIHTGDYAGALALDRPASLDAILACAKAAYKAGLQVNAGHGLHLGNVQAIASIPEIRELNIGHSLIARAMFVGLSASVKEMKDVMLTARRIPAL